MEAEICQWCDPDAAKKHGEGILRRMLKEHRPTNGSMLHIGNTEDKNIPVFACTHCDGGATKIASSNH